MRNRDLDRDRQTKPPKIPILKEFHRQKKTIPNRAAFIVQKK